jgi:hypothetical protein
MAFSNSAALAALFNWSMGLRGKTWLWVLLACYSAGFAASLALFPDWKRPWLEQIVIHALRPFLLIMMVLFPYGIIVLGAWRIRKRRAELEAMDDTLTEVDPEVADRKLREYVAARQSLEARIGLVERSHEHDMANATRTLPEDDPRGLPR